MIRQTSIEAYRSACEDGILSLRRAELYRVVWQHGPMTSAEAYVILIRAVFRTTAITQSRARFTELRDMGLFYEVRTRACTITGRTVIEWDVTSKLPERPQKRAKKKHCATCSCAGRV